MMSELKEATVKDMMRELQGRGLAVVIGYYDIGGQTGETDVIASDSWFAQKVAEYITRHWVEQSKEANEQY